MIPCNPDMNVFANQGVFDTDALDNAPCARSTSRVRFNLDANEAHSPEKQRKKEERYSDSETSGDRKRRSRRRRQRHDDDDNSSSRGGGLMHDPYDRPPSSGSHRRRHSHGGRGREEDDSEESDGTIELPDRFDEHGNRKMEGGDALQHLLGNLAGRFLGGGEDDAGGRRRYRR